MRPLVSLPTGAHVRPQSSQVLFCFFQVLFFAWICTNSLPVCLDNPSLLPLTMSWPNQVLTLHLDLHCTLQQRIWYFYVPYVPQPCLPWGATCGRRASGLRSGLFAQISAYSW